MTRAAQDVQNEALQLTPEERLRLAQELHDSVLTPEEREIQKAWIDVAEQRYDEWKAAARRDRREAKPGIGDDPAQRSNHSCASLTRRCGSSPSTIKPDHVE
jgi:hypothetical protein